jgi:hypothetical protein
MTSTRTKAMSLEFYREIHRAARRGAEQIEHCKCLIEQKIEEDKTALLLKRGDEVISATSIGRFWHHLDITLGNTFRYTLLCGVCAVVEECVNAIAEKLIPDETKRKKDYEKAAKTVKAKKGRTNWLRTGVELFTTEAKISWIANFESDVEQFTDIITLRNCISHVWGNVAMTDYQDQVRETVKRLGLIEKKENTKLVCISTDGYLVLDRDMVSHSICPAVEIVEFLCTAVAGVSA